MKSDQAEDGWRRFLKACTSLKTPEQFEEFFALFLTIEEKEALALRYLIVKGLIDGKATQRELSKDLEVSISKITRGSNALKIISQSLRESLIKSP